MHAAGWDGTGRTIRVPVTPDGKTDILVYHSRNYEKITGDPLGNPDRAIRAQVSYRVIPWQMGVVAKLLRVLPNALFDRLMAGRARKPRRVD